MPFFQQNVSTQVIVGALLTSGGIPSTALTTATLSLIYQNMGAVTTLSFTSVVAKPGGYYQVDLSSNALANLGRIWYAPVFAGGGENIMEGEVMLAANYNLLYGSSAIANVLSSVNWNSETSRLLTSDALAATAVWSATTRNLTSFGVTLGADVWAVTTRNLSSFGVTLGADVWAVTTRTLSSFESIIQGVWEEVITTHTLANSFGKIWTDMTSGTTYQYTSNALSKGLSTFAASDVWSVASRTLTSWGGISTQAWSTVSEASIWANSTRTLTSGLNVAPDIWNYSTRNLTSFGATLGADVWLPTTRTLTVTPASTWGPSDVWTYSTRTLTSGLSPAVDAANAVWAQVIDGALTALQVKRLEVGVLLSESTGGGTTAIAFENWASTKARVSYTVTTNGNRQVSTYDLT